MTSTSDAPRAAPGVDGGKAGVPSEYRDFRAISDLVAYHAASRPDAMALYFEGRRTNWAELDRLSNRAANALVAAGVKRGEHVAYVGRNTDDWLVLFFGACRAGVTFVPINWRLAPQEVAYVVSDSETRILFLGDPSFAPHAEAAGAAAVARPLAVIGMEPGAASGPVFRDWIGARPAEPCGVPVCRDDIALQIYTSGTTGRPKGVMLSNRNFLATREARANGPTYDNWTQDDVTLIWLPMGHVGGAFMCLKALYGGSACIIERELVADRLLETIVSQRVTSLGIVPSALDILLEHARVRQVDYSGIRVMHYGSAPMPLELLKRGMEAFGCDFTQSYGMTETCSNTVMLSPGDHDPEGNDRMRSAGKPLPGVEIAILDSSFNVLPAMAVGQIAVRCAGNMVGYWKQPEATAATIRPDGMLLTGDVGYMDADGYVHVSDRLKDMIISGGENVYSTEVENIVASHPSVAEVAVIGVPHPRWGEVVKAVVVPRKDARLTEDEVIAWAKTQIAGFKCPKIVEFVSALPRNATGKVSKVDLRRQASRSTG